MLLEAIANLALSTAEDGPSITSLRNQFLHLTTLLALNLPSLWLKWLLYLVTTDLSTKICLLLSLLFIYWKASIRSPKNLLFSRLNSPICLSLSSQERFSIPSTNKSMFWAGGPGSGCSAPIWLSPEQSTGADSPLFMQPMTQLVSWAERKHC